MTDLKSDDQHLLELFKILCFFADNRKQISVTGITGILEGVELKACSTEIVYTLALGYENDKATSWVLTATDGMTTLTRLGPLRKFEAGLAERVDDLISEIDLLSRQKKSKAA